MGCTYSDMPSDAGDGFTFRVYNVDGQGVKLNPGKIKVAASHLVLYQKGKEDIRWPLRCLRRYGFDADLFSFECGRRCQTGPGIYAFKCHHAEDLFITVQDSIHRAGEEDQLRAAVTNGGSGSSAGSHAMFTHTPHPTSHPLTFSQPLQQSQQQTTFSMAGGSSPGNTLQMRLMTRPSSSPSSLAEHQYMNGVVPVDSPQYINTGLRSGAFPIEESSPLIDFMNRPGHRGGDGGGNRAQVNYAVILPSSMENLLDEEGQDAVSNFPCPPDDLSHQSLLPDLPCVVAGDSPGGLNPDDIALHAGGDSDVFLPAAADIAEDNNAFRNYINIGANEPSPPIICYHHEADAVTEAGDGAKAGKEGGGGGGGLTVEPFMAPYANLTIHGSGSSAGSQVCGGGLKVKPQQPQQQQQQQQQQPHTSHYLELDLNPALSDCAGASGGVPSQSPTSPISSVSMPESSSSYAKIDFNKTEALSHSSRAGTNGEDEPGARKTRHNSTIGM